MNNNKKLCENKKWELVNFCEFDKYAEKSYCAIHNVDSSKNLGDITKVNEKIYHHSIRFVVAVHALSQVQKFLQRMGIKILKTLKLEIWY